MAEKPAEGGPWKVRLKSGDVEIESCGTNPQTTWAQFQLLYKLAFGDRK